MNLPLPRLDAQSGWMVSLAAFPSPTHPASPPILPNGATEFVVSEAAMFEDATFESMGTIHTRSRNWMIATFGFNGSILALLVAIPLLHPAMLPQIPNLIQVEAPPTPVEPPKPIVLQTSAAAAHSGTQLFVSPFTAPRTIPTGVPNTSEPRQALDPRGLGNPAGLPRTGCDPFNCGSTPTIVQRGAPATAHVSSGVMAGRLLNSVLPIYPPAALAMHIVGRVELQATISRGGTIENLRVMTGPALLRQAALDAVRQWRYQSYLLNGQPVEVETTIDVDFAMN
ncbi:MAG: energy transducer TonB [Terracidiphilus sp.]